MRGKKCWKCKYWTKYYNSNQYFCKRGYCKPTIKAAVEAWNRREN